MLKDDRTHRDVVFANSRTNLVILAPLVSQHLPRLRLPAWGRDWSVTPIDIGIDPQTLARGDIRLVVSIPSPQVATHDSPIPGKPHHRSVLLSNPNLPTNPRDSGPPKRCLVVILMEA
jgi:hypothetical protein